MKSTFIRIAIVFIISFFAVQSSDAAWGYYHHGGCHRGYGRGYYAPAPYSPYPPMWVRPHWHVDRWGRQVWVPGHWS